MPESLGWWGCRSCDIPSNFNNLLDIHSLGVQMYCLCGHEQVSDLKIGDVKSPIYPYVEAVVALEH